MVDRMVMAEVQQLAAPLTRNFLIDEWSQSPQSMVPWLEIFSLITQQFQTAETEALLSEALLPRLLPLCDLGQAEISLYNAVGSLVMVRYEYTEATALRQVNFPLEAPGTWAAVTQFCSWPLVERVAQVYLVLPIVDQRGALGEMRLVRNSAQEFTAFELQLLEQIVAQLAIGLRRNRLIQTINSQSLELKRLRQLQDTFLGTVSYELRVPLANMRMAIQMITLALKHPQDAPVLLSAAVLSKVQRYLEVLDRECDRETKLVQDLLDLQQVDADMLSLVMSAINLAEWLPYELKTYANRAEEYGLSFNCAVDANLPPLMSDQITLSRIVTELVGNAYKFTPTGGSIAVHVRQVDSRMELVVENCGVVIPIEERDRVFEQFYRIPTMDIRRLGGIGLGLALVQQLARRLGGDIRLESAERLTRFVVDLPF